MPPRPLSLEDLEKVVGGGQTLGSAENDVLFGASGDAYVTGGAGNDEFVWSPGGGNDVFDGGADHDTLAIGGLRLSDIQAGLKLDGAEGLRLQVANGEITFADAGGNPASIGGTLAWKGKVLIVRNIEAIRAG
jgi:Ca2+-binding RTX toxin-like protein